MPLQTINPATGETVRIYPDMKEPEVDAVLRDVETAQALWARTDMETRAAAMTRLAGRLRDRSEELAGLMAVEMGKPVTQGRSEIEKCAWLCEYYAEHAAGFLEDVLVETDHAESFVTYRPLGVILAIMPWNYPFWQVIRFASPTLMAGNGAVLKHSNNTTGCALAAEELFREAGFPRHLFRTLVIDVPDVRRVIEHETVRAVSLTGSTGAGKAVAQQAGAVLKPVVLELGGSDAYVVLEDADLEEAAEICVKSRLLNSGQSCIAAKRFIVPQAVREPFEQAIVERMREVHYGDPRLGNARLGPMARADLRDALHRQVLDSLSSGAKLLLGGQIPESIGFFYPATVLTNVKPGMPAYGEELFGPVACILPVANEHEAIQVANDTPFGLGACVLTQDTERGLRIAADELDAGCCFVNGFVRSDPRLPFGGIKMSGYGRELSKSGLLAFVNEKTVVRV
ncbi:MAG: NAD-dependent succinate-semialdehyde dehydrogenase [Bacteroidota bacterium]